MDSTSSQPADVTRSASILALIGQGCHRTSEIAGRLDVPATSLSRSLARLLDLGFAAREVPFGTSVRKTKRTFYRLEDPLLRFWYRFVDPNRSRLGAGQVAAVADEIDHAWPQFLGGAWEALVRQRVAHVEILGDRWQPAERWWGTASDGVPIELDVVANHGSDATRALVGEVKLTASAREARAALATLERNAALCPPLRGKQVTCVLWVLHPTRRVNDPRVLGAEDVVGPLPA